MHRPIVVSHRPRRSRLIETNAPPIDRGEILKGAFAQAVCYAAALGVAVAAGWLVRGQHPLVIVLVADIAATFAVFAFSFAFKNSSLYDPYWSVQPVAIAAFWWLWSTDAEFDPARRLVATVLLAIWAVRLTANFFYGWRGLSQEDWRYVNLQKANGRAYWLVSLTGIHLFPTLLVYAGCLPLMPALNSGPRPWNSTDVFATGVAAAAILLETAADWQLHRFVRINSVPGKTLDTGLWAWSRHPNYLGEIMLWWGLAFFGYAAGGPWWVFAGAIGISALFAFASIPMIEKRNHERRAGYASYCRRVAMLVPFFRIRPTTEA